MVSNGYSLGEIKEMTVDTRANICSLLNAGLSKDDAAAAVALLGDDSDPVNPPAPTDPPNDPDLDYKKLYERTNTELQAARKLLNQQPAGNTDPPRTAAEVLSDMANTIY